jgi:hypothetical protein
MANYPDRSGRSGQFVENSTKLTCLEISGYRFRHSTVLWHLELQIRCGRQVSTHVNTVNCNCQTANCQCSLFSNKTQIIRIFCMSGWLDVPINPEKWSSTVLSSPLRTSQIYSTNIQWTCNIVVHRCRQTDQMKGYVKWQLKFQLALWYYIYNLLYILYYNIIQLLHLSYLLVINCRSKQHKIRYYLWRSAKCGIKKSIFYNQRTNNSPNFKPNFDLLE